MKLCHFAPKGGGAKWRKVKREPFFGLRHWTISCSGSDGVCGNCRYPPVCGPSHKRMTKMRQVATYLVSSPRQRLRNYQSQVSLLQVYMNPQGTQKDQMLSGMLVKKEVRKGAIKNRPKACGPLVVSFWPTSDSKVEDEVHLSSKKCDSNSSKSPTSFEVKCARGTTLVLASL